MQGQLRGAEKITKLAADSIGAGGTLLEIAERLIFKFKSFRFAPRVRVRYGKLGMLKLADRLGLAIKFFAWAGWIPVAWEGYHGYKEWQNGNVGLASAHAISAVAGGALVASSIFSALGLGPVGLAIAIGFVLGSAIYIAMHSRDDIQKWLVATLWRQIPEGENETPAIWPNIQKEMFALQEIIGVEA
jgi:hypothetical protein